LSTKTVIADDYNKIENKYKYYVLFEMSSYATNMDIECYIPDPIQRKIVEKIAEEFKSYSYMHYKTPRRILFFYGSSFNGTDKVMKLLTNNLKSYDKSTVNSTSRVDVDSMMKLTEKTLLIIENPSLNKSMLKHYLSRYGVIDQDEGICIPLPKTIIVLTSVRPNFNDIRNKNSTIIDFSCDISKFKKDLLNEKVLVHDLMNLVVDYMDL